MEREKNGVNLNLRDKKYFYDPVMEIVSNLTALKENINS
jgi:hypothetical protein